MTETTDTQTRRPGASSRKSGRATRSPEDRAAEVEALVRALAGPGREKVRLLVGKPEALDDARARFDGVANVEVVDGRFGDIWLRDTGPIFVETAEGPRAMGFRFNGWGGKYDLEHDDTVAEQLAAATAFMAVFVTAFSLMADAARDALDPKLRGLE